MNKILNKLALAAGIALALGTTGFAFASEPAQKETLSQDLSDARREVQIWTSYAINPHLKALDLKVEVKGEKATLQGTVDSGAAKDLAEEIALNVDGVSKVDNRIAVVAGYEPPKRDATVRAYGDKVDDATITASVKSKLTWNTNTDALDIGVKTQDGTVILTGTAATAAEKDLAGRIARSTSGARGLDNRIVVGEKPTANAKDAPDAGKSTIAAKTPAKPAAPVSDSWITAKVKSTYLLTSDVDGLEITVTTDQGVVKLVGDVDSANERARAVELAQNIRGVRKVDASGVKIR